MCIDATNKQPTYLDKLMKTYTINEISSEFEKSPAWIRKVVAAIRVLHPSPDLLFIKVGRLIEVSQEGHDEIALYLNLGDDGYRQHHGIEINRTSTVQGGELSIQNDPGQSDISQQLDHELPITISTEDGIQMDHVISEGQTKAIRDVALEIAETQVYEETKAQLQQAVKKQKLTAQQSSAKSMFADIFSRHQAREQNPQTIKDTGADTNEFLKALGLGK